MSPCLLMLEWCMNTQDNKWTQVAEVWDVVLKAQELLTLSHRCQSRAVSVPNHRHGDLFRDAKYCSILPSDISLRQSVLNEPPFIYDHPSHLHHQSLQHLRIVFWAASRLHVIIGRRLHAIKRACWVIVNWDVLSLMNEIELRILHSIGAGIVSSINSMFFQSCFLHTISVVLFLIMPSPFAPVTVKAGSKPFVSITSQHSIRLSNVVSWALAQVI